MVPHPPVPVDMTLTTEMESTEGDDEECKAMCIVRDMTNPNWQTSKVTLIVPDTTLVKDFLTKVARKCKYEADSFLLIFQKPGYTDDAELHLDSEESLQDIGVVATSGRRHNFTILEKKLGMLPKRIEGADDDDDDEGDAPVTPVAKFSKSDIDAETPRGLQKTEPQAIGETSTTRTPKACVSFDSSSAASYDSDYSSVYSSSSSLITANSGYVGLVNQAMTCYLNSLVQTLYMTPEFRNALYKWEYDGTPDEDLKSIPFQLQKLFLNLQTSKKRAVETTDLTRSFGWDSSEAWQQHDVQELCRVMFDALEVKFKNTDQAHLINQLYQGKMKDYVRCLECGYESAREDSFLDIPLTIRPFGSEISYKSVEEALSAFVEPETLEGTNKYFCEQCNKKCDAHKGLEFIEFPYLLTLQMKRFDFDYSTMHRIKLNDKMTFPEILNLNQFIRKEPADKPNGPTEEIRENFVSEKPVESNTQDVQEPAIGELIKPLSEDETNKIDGDNSLVKNCENQGNENGLIDDHFGQNEDEGIGLDVNAEEMRTNSINSKQLQEQGPFIYELFSIMIHSGSAAGGHYYAYIKSFLDGQWYCFNDQSVQKITYDDIRKTYGGGSGRGYTSTYTSSTNAYMLMYRQIDKSRNAEPMKVAGFPDHLVQLMQLMSTESEENEKRKEAERCVCRIKLYCNHPMEGKIVEKKMHIHKDDTLEEATRKAYEMMELDGIYTFDQVRLVKYDEFHDSIEESFEDVDGKTMGELLGGVLSSYKFDLLLELQEPGVKFQVYKPGGITCKLHIVDTEVEIVHPPLNMRAYTSDTLNDFKKQISEYTGLPSDSMKVVLEKYNTDLRLLADGENTLRSQGFFRSEKVYVDCSSTEDTESFSESKLYRLLQLFRNTVRISVVLPPLQECEDLRMALEHLGYVSCSAETPASDTEPKLATECTFSVHSPANSFEAVQDSLSVDSGLSSDFSRNSVCTVSSDDKTNIDSDIVSVLDNCAKTDDTGAAPVNDSTGKLSTCDKLPPEQQLSVPVDFPDVPCISKEITIEQPVIADTKVEQNSNNNNDKNSKDGSSASPEKKSCESDESPKKVKKVKKGVKKKKKEPAVTDELAKVPVSLEATENASVEIKAESRCCKSEITSSVSDTGKQTTSLLKQSSTSVHKKSEVKGSSFSEMSSSSVMVEKTEISHVTTKASSSLLSRISKFSGACVSDDKYQPAKHRSSFTSDKTCTTKPVKPQETKDRPLDSAETLPSKTAVQSSECKAVSTDSLATSSATGPPSAVKAAGDSPEISSSAPSPEKKKKIVKKEKPKAPKDDVKPPVTDEAKFDLATEAAEGFVPPYLCQIDSGEKPSFNVYEPLPELDSASVPKTETEKPDKLISDLISTAELADKALNGIKPAVEEDLAKHISNLQAVSGVDTAAADAVSDVTNEVKPQPSTSAIDESLAEDMPLPGNLLDSPPKSSSDHSPNASLDDSKSPDYFKRESPVQSSMIDISSPEAKESWESDLGDGDHCRLPGTDSEQVAEQSEDESTAKRYFQATEHINNITSQRVLTIYVDKRFTLAHLKRKLEGYVNVPVDHFKLYRVYSNNQEFECSRLNETLMSYSDDSKLTVKLGRALKKGEYKVKVFQLCVNDAEPCKPLIDTIFTKGMTVLESKHLILPEIKNKCDLDIPLNRCRLRKKNWKNPGAIYLDWQRYEEHISIFSNWDIFVEMLDEPEKMTDDAQLALYVRRWRPSDLKLDGFQEIILKSHAVGELKTKISELSGIDVVNVSFAKSRGTFPCDISLLDIEGELEWNPETSQLNTWPIYINDDGAVVYYKDKDEKLIELSEEQKKEIQKKEAARLNVATKYSYSPRKEKALKIYTDDNPKPKSLEDD